MIIQKKLETLLFFIIEILLPKQAFKNSEGKSIINSVGNTNGVVIGNPPNEMRSKSMNNNYTSNNFSNVITRNPMAKTNLEGINEGIFKSLFEKLMENNNKKGDFIPMLTSSKEGEILRLAELPGLNYDKNENNRPKEESGAIKSFEDEASGLFRNPSPNPFLEDLSFAGSNIFNSPQRRENFQFFSQNPTGKSENDENILNDNFNQSDIGRNNSIDLNELLYKKEETEEYMKKIHTDNFKDYIFDESYFSVTEDKNKNTLSKDNK